MLKTFLLTLILLFIAVLGWFFWNNAPMIPQAGSLEAMTQEEYKIFVKKALTRNTPPKSYITSKGKILLNSWYMVPSQKNGINEQNITVWSLDASKKTSPLNPKNISVWILWKSGMLESNMAEIEAERKKQEQESKKRNAYKNSSGKNWEASQSKLLGLTTQFPTKLQNLNSSLGGDEGLSDTPLGSQLETESDEAKSSGISKLEVWGEQVNGGSLYNQIIDISEKLPESGEKYYKTYKNPQS